MVLGKNALKIFRRRFFYTCTEFALDLFAPVQIRPCTIRLFCFFAWRTIRGGRGLIQARFFAGRAQKPKLHFNYYFYIKSNINLIIALKHNLKQTTRDPHEDHYHRL